MRATMTTSTAMEIIRSVSDRTGVGVLDILSDDRSRHLVRARNQAYLALIEGGASYSHTGRLMQRHHTTVMHGVRAARGDAA